MRAVQAPGALQTLKCSPVIHCLCPWMPQASIASLMPACAGAVLSLAQTHRGRPQTTSTRLYAGGELQGSPVWQALAGHTSSQDEALARYSVSREVPCSVLKWETVLGSLDATPKVP